MRKHCAGWGIKMSSKISSKISSMALAGKDEADADDRAKAMVVEFRGRFYATAIWINPDDEDSVPLATVGPYKSRSEAERKRKKVERWIAPCDLDEDTLSDSLRHRCGLTIHESVLALAEMA